MNNPKNVQYLSISESHKVKVRKSVKFNIFLDLKVQNVLLFRW